MSSLRTALNGRPGAVEIKKSAGGECKRGIVQMLLTALNGRPGAMQLLNELSSEGWGEG